MKSRKRMIIFLFSLPAFVLFAFLFMQQKSFGQKPRNHRLERVKLSENYRDGAFQNQSPTPVMTSEASFWKLSREFMHKHPNTEPTAPIPSIKTDLKRTVSGQTRIVWLGHSSYLIQIDTFTIVVDLILSKRASPVSFAGVTCFPGTMVYSASDFPNPDVYLSTHDHYDHLDYPTVCKFKDKASHFVTPLGVGQHLECWGIDTAKIKEFDWWQGVEIAPGIQIVATPARHFSGRGFVRNQSLWASFVIITAKHRIFIGGDSGYGMHYKQIGEKYGPFDIAMLECGQYNSYWPFIHETPEQAVQAGIDLNAKVLMPVHWGKFKLSMHPWTESVERFLAKTKELNLSSTTPMIGEAVVLDESYPHKEWWKEVGK